MSATWGDLSLGCDAPAHDAGQGGAKQAPLTMAMPASSAAQDFFMRYMAAMAHLHITPASRDHPGPDCISEWEARQRARAHHAVPAPAKMNSKTGPQPHRLHVQHCSNAMTQPSVWDVTDYEESIRPYGRLVILLGRSIGAGRPHSPGRGRLGWLR